MTVREYLVSELRPFGVTEAELADLSMSMAAPLADEYSAGNAREVRRGLAAALPAFILKPRMTGVSEGGFSVTWDCSNLAKYYYWLCGQVGLEPDAGVTELAGLSAITDKSDLW